MKIKPISALLLILSIVGCVTVKIPKYLQDEFPYRKTFETSFENTFTATLKALKDTGWRVTETTSPIMFGPGNEADKSKKYEVLIFTEIKQSPLFLASSYASLNALLKAQDQTHTVVEIRYLSMIALPFKAIKTYQNDRLIERIFKNIELSLKK
ncbi:MAG: hypothetical protein Q8O13_02560 [Candidatus Omnitrophota bacterium]|nr:hypothetical protein [Candidatus Omnitrophota bacterium]